MSLDKLKPCRKGHAVKEASITIFLTHPIEEIERFKGFFDDSLKTLFSKFELVHDQQLSVKLGVNKNPELTHDKEPQLSGFKMIKNQENRTTQVFRGANEPDRSYFSFHDLQYVRWANFKELFNNCLTGIGSMGGFKVKAVAVHFLDEFQWNSSESIPYKKIFKDKGRVLPRIFNESENAEYLLTRSPIKREEVTKVLTDRIQVNGYYNGKESGSKVTISHNLTQFFDSSEDVSTFIESEEFLKEIDYAHNENKNLLRGLLCEELQKRIKLNG